MNSKQWKALAHVARKEGATLPQRESFTKPKPVVPAKTSHFKRSLIRVWPRAWGGILAIITIAGACYQFRPSISIEAEATLNPNNPYSTQFRVTNSGLLNLYDVSFGASFEKTPRIGGFTLHAPNAGLGPIASLASGESATRSMPVLEIGFRDEHDIELIVRYRATFYGKRTTTVRFVSKADSEGHLRWFHQAVGLR
jgi:hypothetical protein